MNIKSLCTTIILSNNKEKKFLSFKSFNNDESKKSNLVEIENVLENSIIKNFLNTNIISIKCVRTFVGNNNYRECIELKNTGNSSLVIISDDVNKHFKDLLDYINENRTKIYEKSLFDIICKYEINEIVFKLSNNKLYSGIDVIVEDNKRKIIYNVPYNNDNNKNIINPQDLNLIENTINNYFGITACKLKGTYDDASFGYMKQFKMYTDKADISIDNHELYSGLELYFNMIKKDHEMLMLKEREEIFKESQKNINKKRFRVLKKEDINEE